MSELTYIPLPGARGARLELRDLTDHPSSLLRVICDTVENPWLKGLSLLVGQAPDLELWTMNLKSHVAEKSEVDQGPSEYSDEFWRSEVAALRHQGQDSDVIVCLAGQRHRDFVLVKAKFEGDSSRLKDLVEVFSEIRPLARITLNFQNLQRLSARASEEIRHYRDKERRHYVFKELIRESHEMQRMYTSLNAFVDMDVPVLLGGEGGTGKELLARALHHLSKRPGLMVALNVRTTPADELDTDLFGAVENVFAGTTTARKGAFELAENGTVYLQEIDALSLVQQGKLLRVLEESKVRRRGATRSYAVSARFVASCHQDLSVLVEAGKFRDDLYTFLSRHVLVVPALRERKEDIMPLARIFLRMYAERHTRAAQKFAEEVSDFLVTQPWPGNVRELQTRVESAVLHSQGAEVLLSDFCPGRLGDSTDPFQS